MDIIGLITNLIGGAVGGNATGAGLKDLSLGTLGNTVAGVVGGALGGYILQAVNFLNMMGLADTTLNTVMSQAGAGIVSGGVLTAVVGLIRNMMNK